MKLTVQNFVPIFLLLVAAKAASAAEVQSSKPFCQALFLGHTAQDIRLLQTLSDRRVVSEKQVEEILDGKKTSKIAESLERRGKISESEYDSLLDGFADLEANHLVGRSNKIATLKSSISSATRSEVLLQRYQPDLSDQGFAIRDIDTRKFLGTVDVQIEDKTMTVDLIRVQKRERRERYSELLLREALKANPGMTRIEGWLAGTNLGILKYGLKQGLSREEAALRVPLYRTFEKLGFNPQLQQDPATAGYWVSGHRIPIGPAETLKNGISQQELLLQEFAPGIGRKNFSLLDPIDRRTLASASFEIRDGNVLYLNRIFVSQDKRNSGYSKLLIEQILKKFPNVTTLNAVFTETNEDVMNDLLAEGLSAQEAIYRTPLGRALVHLGFTSLTARDHKMMEGLRIFGVTARRP